MFETFEGGVFDDALETGRRGGAVSFDSQGIRLDAGDGSQSWLVSWEVVEITQGGARGTMLFFKDRESGVLIFTDEKGAQSAGELASGPGYEHLWDAVRSHTSSRRFTVVAGWSALLVVLGLMFFGGTYYAESGLSLVLDNVPTSVDKALGEQAAGSLAEIGQPIEDEAVRQLCMDIFEVVKAQAPQDEGFEYKLAVLENEMPNAFAMPGGQMVILTGLLKTLQSPEEVAGVLAHELAHVYRRHSVKRLVQTVGLVTVGQLVLGDIGGAAAAIANMAGFAMLQHYSREAEEDADLRGAELLHQAGIEPEALAQAFTRLQEHMELEASAEATTDTPDKEQGDTESAGERPALPDPKDDSESASEEEDTTELAEKLEGWLSSHPDLDVRMATVRAHAATLGAIRTPYTFDVDWSVVERLRADNKTEKEE